MGKLVGWLVGTFLLFWVGLGVGIWWEHRPANWPAVEMNLVFWHPKFGFGDGLAAKLAKVEPALQQCRVNSATLQGALDRQNRAVAALKVAGDQLTADAAKAVQQAHSAGLGLNKRASVLISTPPAGNDVCERAQSAFERVKGDLK